MKDWDPLVVRGHHIIQLLNEISDQTLKSIKAELGEPTFANHDLIKIVDKAIMNRKKKDTIEQFETISIEEPDFWDE